MSFFRRKPVMIEAEQFFRHKPLPFADRHAVAFNGAEFYVTTAHDQPVYLKDGDWIVPEPNGKGFYPVKPDIFAASYDQVLEGVEEALPIPYIDGRKP